MPAPTSTKWITVDKFLGIKQVGEGLISSSPQPPGALASTDDNSNPATYDCVSIPTGGIGPTPFAFQLLWSGPTPNPNVGNNLTGGALPFYAVGGLHVPQIMTYEHVTPGVYQGRDFASLFVNLNYIFDTGGGAANPQPRRFRMYKVDVSGGGAGGIHELTDTVGALPFHDSTTILSPWWTWQGYTPMADYRSATPAAATTPGNFLQLIAMCSPGSHGEFTYRYPNLAGIPTQVGLLSNVIRCVTHLVSHQGRAVINGLQTPFTLDNSGILHNDDNVWTQPNQDALDNAGFISAFSQATIGSYGVMATSSASELILIRTSAHGGMVISSDMNDPIITDYPGIQGTNGAHMEGCWSPVGFIYGAEQGSIYAYVGGGRCIDIAGDMDPGFWGCKTSNGKLGQGFNDSAGFSFPAGVRDPILHHMGQFAYHGGFVFCPGNWLYDVESQSWWRFKTPVNGVDTSSTNSEFSGFWFASSPMGSVYCSPSYWKDNGAHTNALISDSLFNIQTAKSWKATTQPIAISANDEISEVREFVIEGIAVDNPATFAVTLTSQPNGQTFTHTFQFTTSQRTEAMRCSVPSNIRGTHVRVAIVATDVPAASAAPTLMRFSLGLAPVAMITNA